MEPRKNADRWLSFSSLSFWMAFYRPHSFSVHSLPTISILDGKLFPTDMQ